MFQTTQHGGRRRLADVEHLAELHDDMHHVTLLVALVVLDNVRVVQAVQHLHLILSLQHTHRHFQFVHVSIYVCAGVQ